MSTSTQIANHCSSELRSQRARIKASMRRGDVTLIEVFKSPALHTMKVSKLLEQIPWLSPPKVGRILLVLGIGYARPVGELTRTERENILRIIRQRHPRAKITP